MSVVMALLSNLLGLLRAAVRFLFLLHPHWLERSPASDHSQLFLTSKVPSPSYQRAQQLRTVLISLIETEQVRFAEIIWILVIEMPLLLAAVQEPNRKTTIIRKRLRMNI